MQNGSTENTENQMRSEGRTSYTVKKSLVSDILAGGISILLAVAVWLVTH